MNNIEEINYSLNDKFLSMETEKRISRRQFFSRIFVPWILLWLISAVIIPAINAFIIPSITMFFTSINSIVAMMVVSYIYIFIYYWVILFFVPKLIIKRCHDFNISWIIIKRLFVITLVIYIIMNILLLLSMFIEELSFISNFIILMPISNYILIILVLYLSIRPWTKWANDFWDDTGNVKIGFLW
ncbi:MAG: hypothetical protein ACD_49C00082G0009 [uncultured bacterium (gcode 4)]|uniref:Uncharacterized protein n=1 Tax=uncultured bacterium (gcode 4) TaxID=1234023 RepID=K2ACV4_9BACT|nr:MAG: hypothetical protein ACD_49C00082G0009 [uncultured bacterium (gcode 4)]